MLSVLDIESSTVAGAGTGNRKLYLLASNGKLYSLDIEDDGSPSSGAQITLEDDNFVPSGGGSAGNARIHVHGGSNDHVYFTGRNNHVVGKKKTQNKFACCQAGLF